jgi:hypothetical protein
MSTGTSSLIYLSGSGLFTFEKTFFSQLAINLFTFEKTFFRQLAISPFYSEK